MELKSHPGARLSSADSAPERAKRFEIAAVMGTPEELLAPGWPQLAQLRCVAQALTHAPVRITLIDRRNHHLFQPLLYQVATAALNASDYR